MTVRVHYAEVKLVINTDLTKPVVESMIVTANIFVNSILSGEDLGADLLKEIEKWMTAHIISISKERQPEKIEIGDAVEEYARLGQGLASTTYGQMVINLDTSGKMKLAYKVKAIIKAVTSF